MKRIVVMLALTILLAAALALPVFAAAGEQNEYPSCVGNAASMTNDPEGPYEPGSGGELVSVAGQTGLFGVAASTNCGFGYPGG